MTPCPSFFVYRLVTKLLISGSDTMLPFTREMTYLRYGICFDLILNIVILIFVEPKGMTTSQ